jgi:hypothetical protein
MRIKIFRLLQVIRIFVPCVSFLHRSECSFHLDVVVVESGLEPRRETAHLIRGRRAKAWWSRRASKLFWRDPWQPIWTVEQCHQVGDPTIGIKTECIVVRAVVSWLPSEVFVVSWHLSGMSSEYIVPIHGVTLYSGCTSFPIERVLKREIGFLLAVGANSLRKWTPEL